MIRNLLFLGVYTVVLCEVILSVFVVLWGMCLFLGERYIIIRASDRKYELCCQGGCNGKYSNDSVLQINKGGSGKSTSCSNVGAALAGMGKKVLMVDGDMQLNLSLSFFSEEEVLEMAAGEKNLYYAIGHQSDLSDFIVHTKYENLDLVPSSTLMSSVEYELFTKWQREFILRKCLQKVKDSGVYDYILIDAPPTLGGWVRIFYVHPVMFLFR